MPITPWPNGKPINEVDATSAAPAACGFQDRLYLFWVANDPSNRIYYSASPLTARDIPDKAGPGGRLSTTSTRHPLLLQCACFKTSFTCSGSIPRMPGFTPVHLPTAKRLGLQSDAREESRLSAQG
jgi:hypothetical protein